MVGETVLMAGVLAGALLLPRRRKRRKARAKAREWLPARSASSSNTALPAPSARSPAARSRSVCSSPATRSDHEGTQGRWDLEGREADVTTNGNRGKLKVLYGVFGNILGLDQIAEACA